MDFCFIPIFWLFIPIFWRVFWSHGQTMGDVVSIRVQQINARCCNSLIRRRPFKFWTIPVKNTVNNDKNDQDGQKFEWFVTG